MVVGGGNSPASRFWLQFGGNKLNENPDNLVLDKLDQIIRILEALLAKVEILIQMMREKNKNASS